MSDDKAEGGFRIGGAPLGMVKGGTTPASYDAEMNRRREDAERRRDHQDRAYAWQTQAQKHGEAAKLGSMMFMDRGSPRLVLYYMAKDGTVAFECKSEITLVPDEEKPTQWQTMFAMVCPKCVARGVPQGESQMLVRDTHRRFWLDERRKGEIVMLKYTWGFRESVILAGTVTVQDVVKCSNFNCDYAVRIEDSKVYEV